MTYTSKGAEKTPPPEKRKKKKRRRVSDKNHNNDNEMPAWDDDEEPVETLIEPLPKENLIDLLLNAAVEHQDVADRIRMVADEDLMYRKILVYGLRWNTNAEMLANAFKPYGEIESCLAVTDNVSGKCKGYGFILFKRRSGARKALMKPRKMIGNRIASCQFVPQKLVASPRLITQSPREEEARACARILAEPYRLSGSQLITRIRVDTPEPIEVELKPDEYNIYEKELRKMYLDKVILDLLKDGAPREWCTTVLRFYNKTNNTDYVLLETVVECLFYAGGCPRFVYHVNFKAKKQNGDDRDALLLFAEVEPHGPAKLPTVLECTILNNDFQTHCRGCNPRLKIKHPVGEFYANRQIGLEEPMLSAWDYWGYLSQDAEVDEGAEVSQDAKVDEEVEVECGHTSNYTDYQMLVGDGEGDGEDEEPIERVIESLPREHLINLLRDAAEMHQDMAAQIRMVADEAMVHRKILVYGLGGDTNDETLLNAFKPYGEIKTCTAVTELGGCKGYGFILFESWSGARKALKEPQKRIDNRMAMCQLAPQKFVNSMEPSLCSMDMEEEARAYARMRARPIGRFSTLVDFFRIDFPEPMDVELGPKESEIYDEELKKMYLESEMLDLPVDKSAAVKYSPVALDYYNEKNYKNYVLVEAVMLNGFFAGAGRMVCHLNFRAKKRHEDNTDAVMFFAELQLRGRDVPPTILVCMILNTDIQTYCRCCDPRLKIQHPVGGFDLSCQTKYVERQLSRHEYLKFLSNRRFA